MNIIDTYNNNLVFIKEQNQRLIQAACAKLIIDNWYGPILNESFIIKTLLLHNIIELETNDLLDKGLFLNNENIMNSNDFNIKIILYCKQKVGLDNIYSLYTRLIDAKKDDIYIKELDDEQINYLIKCAREIEKQIFKYTLLDIDDINKETINLEEIKNMEV